MVEKGRERMKSGLALVFGGNTAVANEPEAQSAQPVVSPADVDKNVEPEAVAKPKARKKSVKTEQPLIAAPTIQGEQKERIQPFNLHIPESLHTRLKFFVDNYARRHESMTKIILDGLEEKLSNLEKRDGVGEGKK